jgi:hypothetical protein
MGTDHYLLEKVRKKEEEALHQTNLHTRRNEVACK